MNMSSTMLARSWGARITSGISSRGATITEELIGSVNRKWDSQPKPHDRFNLRFNSSMRLTAGMLAKISAAGKCSAGSTTAFLLKEVALSQGGFGKPKRHPRFLLLKQEARWRKSCLLTSNVLSVDLARSTGEESAVQGCRGVSK